MIEENEKKISQTAPKSPKSTKKTSAQLKPQQLSERTKKLIYNGKLSFLENNARHPEVFDIKTPFSDEINEWIEKEIPEGYVRTLNIGHRYQYCLIKKDLRLFTSLNTSYLAFACNVLFWPHIKDNVKLSYLEFTSMPEPFGAATHSIPDYTVSLLHRAGGKHIPFILSEEKTDAEKLSKSGQNNENYLTLFFVREFRRQFVSQFFLFVYILRDSS